MADISRWSVIVGHVSHISHNDYTDSRSTEALALYDKRGESPIICFEPLPPDATSPPLTGSVTIAFDPDYSRNKTVYAASTTQNKGIYRFIIGKSSEWESIDATLPDGGMIGQLVTSADGILYAPLCRHESNSLAFCSAQSIVSALLECFLVQLSYDYLLVIISTFL